MRSGLLIGAAALLIATGCSSEEAAEPGTFDSVADGICAAIDVPDDFDTMKRIFDDDVHAGLHDLVAELEDDERELAGRILVAKNKVESDLAEQESTRVLKRDFSDLLGTVEEGIAALDMEVPECVISESGS
jgi:hypothetical protein